MFVDKILNVPGKKGSLIVWKIKGFIQWNLNSAGQLQHTEIMQGVNFESWINFNLLFKSAVSLYKLRLFKYIFYFLFLGFVVILREVFT